MRTCLLVLLLIHTVFTTYILNKTQSLSPANYTAVSLSRGAKTINDEAVDVALGLSNGSIFLTNTENFHSQTSFSAFENSPIISMEWYDFGIFALSTKGLKIIQTLSLKTSFELNFQQNIISASLAIRAGTTVVTAVSLGNRIQIYEDTQLIYTIHTTAPCKGLTVDHTGKYLYYYDSYTRYVWDIVTRTQYEHLYIETKHIAVVASSVVDKEDITMSLNSEGNLYVYDDYMQLARYTGISGQNQLKLGGNPNQLFTYSTFTQAINIYQINYYNFTNWARSQEIKITGGGSQVAMDAKNSKVVYLAGSSLVIYTVDSTTYSGLVILIVFVGVFVCCGLCCFLNQKYGLRNIFNVRAWRARQAQKDQVSANYVGFNSTKNTIISQESSNVPPVPALYPPQQYSPPLFPAPQVQDPYIPPQLYPQPVPPQQPYSQPILQPIPQPIPQPIAQQPLYPQQQLSPYSQQVAPSQQIPYSQPQLQQQFPPQQPYSQQQPPYPKQSYQSPQQLPYSQQSPLQQLPPPQQPYAQPTYPQPTYPQPTYPQQNQPYPPSNYPTGPSQQQPYPQNINMGNQQILIPNNQHNPYYLPPSDADLHHNAPTNINPSINGPDSSRNPNSL